MKRILCLCLAFCFLFLTSCGEKKPLLTASLYGEEFKEQNRILFYHPDCEHYEIYDDADTIDKTVDGNLYHAVRCKWGHCSYEAHLEPHTIDISDLKDGNSPSRAFLQENGMCYHIVYTTCTKCEKSIQLFVYCPRQGENCRDDNGKTICLSEYDWRKVLCDTPYEISDG